MHQPEMKYIKEEPVPKITSSSGVTYVRLTPEERDMLEKLAKYLHKLGKIDQPTLSEALRVCLHFTVNEILKAIEADRYMR